MIIFSAFDGTEFLCSKVNKFDVKWLFLSGFILKSQKKQQNKLQLNRSKLKMTSKKTAFLP